MNLNVFKNLFGNKQLFANYWTQKVKNNVQIPLKVDILKNLRRQVSSIKISLWNKISGSKNKKYGIESNNIYEFIWVEL